MDREKVGAGVQPYLASASGHAHQTDGAQAVVQNAMDYLRDGVGVGVAGVAAAAAVVVVVVVVVAVAAAAVEAAVAG
jgi:hypothetical protein